MYARSQQCRFSHNFQELLASIYSYWPECLVGSYIQWAGILDPEIQPGSPGPAYLHRMICPRIPTEGDADREFIVPK